jgi:uncharacterized protein DUF2336
MPPILSNLDGLIGLSRRHGLDIKPTLLRVLTDLYIQKPTHTADEELQFTTLVLRLLDVVDPPTLAIVKDKLAAYEGAPIAVLRHLFGGNVPALPSPAPARRDQVGQAPTPAFPRAAPSQQASGGTVAADATESFFAADPAERRRILARLDNVETAVPMPSSPADTQSAIRRLEEAALGGRPGDFIRELEAALRISRETAQHIVNDPTGEPVVVAAKALGMPLSVLQRILLFVNPAVGHSVRRVYELSALYDEISATAARCLVTRWRGTAPAASRPPTAATSAQDRTARRVRELSTGSGRERPGAIDLDEELFADRPQRAG